MSIKCGHCQGRHATVREVRICSEDQKALAKPQRPGPDGCGCDVGNGVFCNAHRRANGMSLTKAYND
jgi:hypothetical protein